MDSSIQNVHFMCFDDRWIIRISFRSITTPNVKYWKVTKNKTYRIRWTNRIRTYWMRQIHHSVRLLYTFYDFNEFHEDVFASYMTHRTGHEWQKEKREKADLCGTGIHTSCYPVTSLRNFFQYRSDHWVLKSDPIAFHSITNVFVSESSRSRPHLMIRNWQNLSFQGKNFVLFELSVISTEWINVSFSLTDKT